MKWMHMAAFTLTVVGGLNWGSVALLNLNLVEMAFGMGGLSTVIYALVGASALYLVFNHKGDCKTCAM